MSSWTATATATPVEATRSSPTVPAFVSLDTPLTHAESALLSADLDNSPSRDHAPPAHSTPYSTLPSTAAPALQDSTWALMECARG